MRHLGILGHSVEGALLCFRTFCQEGHRQIGEHEHPDVTLDCISMARSMPGWESGDYDSIREILATSVDRLEAAGAEFFVCPDNTAHIALERPGRDLRLPGLHIAEVVADRASREGYERVGVLGTKFTMEGPVYPRAFGNRGIAWAVPETNERAVVNRIIFEELVNGQFLEGSRDVYLHAIERFAKADCDAVALVCTEIPLLISPEISPLPVLDSTRLLARAAFEVAAEREPLPSWHGGGDIESRHRAGWS